MSPPIDTSPDSATPYRGRSVCVTGGTGFLGEHLLRRLLAQEARVTVLARDATRLPPDLRPHLHLVEGDLCDPGSLPALVADTQVVFHCAANVKTWDRWSAYRDVNVDGTENLLNAICDMASVRPRIVHVSTVDVYGFPEKPAAEDDATRPVRYGYGESKRLGELRLREACDRLALDWSVLRPGNIIGPGSPFIRRIGAQFDQGIMLSIDRGRAHAGLIDVNNLVDLLLWAGHAPRATGRVFNARDPHETTWDTFLDDLKAGLQRRSLIVDLPRKPAMGLARLIAATHGSLRLPGEPFLHPLVVDIFGRTCGHRIDRLLQAGAPVGRIGYPESLQQSLNWFEQHGRRT